MDAARKTTPNNPPPTGVVTTPVTTPQATAAITSPTTTPSGIKYQIIIATGGVGGVYYYYGATIAGIISNYTDITLQVFRQLPL